MVAPHFFSLHRLSFVFPKVLSRSQCSTSCFFCPKYLLARLFALGSDAKVSLVWREVWTADDLLSAILGRPHLRLWRYANACPSDDGLSSKSDSPSLPSLVCVSFLFFWSWFPQQHDTWTVFSTTCWWSQLVWWFLAGNISFHILHVCASFSPKLGLVV